jgi:hypothetical protein
MTWKPGIVRIDGHVVRVRRNWGVSTPPWCWDVMDGDRIAETFCSAPSGSDCAAAIARHRSNGAHRIDQINEATARAIATGHQERRHVRLSPRRRDGHH